jgi:ATP-binding cassette subfamily B protein
METPRTEASSVEQAPAVSLRTIAWRFWPWLRPHFKQSTAVIAAGLVSPALEATSIWLFKLVVDRVLVPHELSNLGKIALAYLALVAVQGGVSFAGDYLSTALAERFLLALRSDLLEHIHALSLDFLERRRLGDLLTRLTSDVGAIEEFLLSGAIRAIEQGVRLIVFVGALFVLEWRLALVALVAAPPFWYAARRLSARLRELSRERRRRSGAVAALVEESISNAALVQAYGTQKMELARFRREAEAAVRAQLASARLRAAFAPLVDLIEMAGGLLVLAAATWELSRGRLTLGGVLAFITYLGKLYGPIRGIASFNNAAHTAAAGAERVIELLDQPPAVRVRSGARRLLRPRGELEFDHVWFRYPGAAQDALADLSFRLVPGETLALVGPSGAGKSTVLKLLLRFHDPDAGAIRIDGHDLRDLDLESARSAIAVLFQDALVFHASVRENIAYGRVGASDADILRAARLADADAFVADLAQGYDTPIGQKGRRISGGQRQRLAIARAMIRDAPILVLDEPTTSLDDLSARRILLPLQRLMEGRSTLLISHDLRVVRSASRIVMLEHGRVVEAGAHRDLLARCGPYQELTREEAWLTT